MAHGWDSYFHNLQALPSDPGALRKTSESEGGLSQHIENFVGHHDFNSTVASHEAPETTSNFSTNYFSNPNIGNASSDCVYQRYYTETTWPTDGEQMDKDFLPRCGNSDISDFATSGLSTSGTFPSSFAADLQGLKQDCGMLATPFLEDYSDISSSPDTDIGEIRPSCKFMSNNSVPKLKTDLTTKHNLPEWLFSHTGNMFPAESICSNMADRNTILPGQSNVPASENIVDCAQDKIESPEKTSTSYTEHESPSMSDVVITTGSQTVEDKNNSDDCLDQKQKEDVKGDQSGKQSDILVTSHKNVTRERIEEYSYGNEEEQINPAAGDITFDNDQDHVDERVLKNEMRKSFNEESEEYDHLNPTDDQDTAMREDEQDKSEGKESTSEQKSPNANSSDGQDEHMETDCQEKEIKSNTSESYKNLVQDNNCRSPPMTCDGHFDIESDHAEQGLDDNAQPCLQPNSSSTGINPCLEKVWTSTRENTNTTLFPDPNCSGFDDTGDSLCPDTCVKSRKSIADDPEFHLQTTKSGAEINPCVKTDLTDPAERTNTTSSTDPGCSGSAVTIDKNEQSICSHIEPCLKPNSFNTVITPSPEKDWVCTTEKTNTTPSPDPDCGSSSAISDKNKQTVFGPESGLQTDSSGTDVNPCIVMEMTSPSEMIINSSVDPDCSGSGVTSDCHLVDTSDKNEQSVDSHSESCLQQDGSAASMCSCAEKEWTSSTRKISATSIPDPECSSPAMTSGPNALNVSHSLECGLQSDTSTTDNNPGLTKEWTSPAENSDTTASSDQQWSPQTPEAQEPQTPEGIVAENARGSFEELDTSIQGQVLLGMLYGEPLSREYSSCDTEEMKPDTCQYKVKLDRPDRTHVDDSKRQLPQLKSSGQMRRHLQPVVILKTLESTNGMGNSYYCAKCQHTTHNVDHLIEHHSCCHSLPKFQYCKTCNLYLMVNEQTEKHLCGKTKESPQQTSDSSLQGKRKRHGRHKCTRCGLVFSKLVKYISHTRIHTGKTPYKCNGCGLYFAQGSSLQRHMRVPGRCKPRRLPVTSSDDVTSKTKAPPQKDLVENKPFANLPECYVMLADISKTDLCGLSGKSFSTEDKSKQHFNNMHKGKILPDASNQCSPKVSGEETQKVPNEASGKYKCPLCPRLFKYSYNRARHLRHCIRKSICGGKDKVDGKYPCPLCHTTFTLSSNRYRHIKTSCFRECLSRLAKNKAKSQQKTEQIQTNETEQEIQSNVNEPIKQPPPAKTAPKAFPRYQCNLCPAVFFYASGKYRHMKKHELFKLTGKVFKYRNSVLSMSDPATLSSTQHQNSKDKLPEVTSSLGLTCRFCGKSFSVSKSLKKHEHTHQGETPYRCLECGKRFKKRAYLIGHKNVHQRMIQCTVCRKVLPTIGDLIQHRRSHLIKGKLECPDCHQQFQYPVYLLRHLEVHKKRENKTLQLEERSPLKSHQSLKSVEEDSEPKQIQCSLCKDVFDNAEVLKKHCLTHISGSLPNQCPFCKQNFSKRHYLLQHMVKHTGDKPFCCKNCGKRFYRAMYLKVHSQSCLPAQTENLITVDADTKTKRPYQCVYCPRTFSKKTRLKDHHRGHKRNSLLLCSRCGQYFGFTKLNQHQKNCGETAELSTGSHNCDSSQIPSPTNQNVQKMSLESSATKMFQFNCPHCRQRFRYRSLLLRHLVSHTGLQPYACMHCGHRYASQTACLQHEAFCDGVYKEGLSRDKSGPAIKLSNVSTLREAIQTSQVEGEAEYKCKFCTKTFLKSRNLRRHILSHNEVKPYRCKACDSCFSRYDHLKVHQTRCKGKRQRLEVCIPKISLDDVGKGWQNKFGNEPPKKQETFECEVCPRSFSTQSKLSRHVTMFHVTKLFKCMRCDTSFAHEKSLKKHKKRKKCRKVSNETDGSVPQETKPPTENMTKSLHQVKNQILQRIKPCFNKKYKYVCSYCPRAFLSSWQLRVHTRLHTGEKPFACDDCGQRFIRKDYVQRHSTKCTKKPQQKNVPCDRCGGFFPKIIAESHKKNCTPTPNLSKSAVCESQSPPKGFSCAYCNSRFLLFSQLQEHFLNEHKLETMAPPVSTAPLQHHLSNIPNIKEEPLDENCDDRRSEGSSVICRLDTALESDVSKQFFCRECDVSFLSKAGLTAHLRGHAMAPPFNCKTCKKGFWNKTLLRNHNRKCRFGLFSERNSGKEVEVPLKAEIDIALNDSVLVFKESSKTTGTGVLQTNFSCKDDSMDKSPQNSEEAEAQSSSSKEKKAVQYQCSECDMSFTDGLLLISHLEDHGREEQEKRRNTCIKCGRMFTSRSYLEKHMKNVHGTDDKYSCPDCSKVVHSLSDLEIHRTCHDLSRPYACKLCSQRFLSRMSLCSHYNEEHPDDVFSCRFCNKTYSVKKSLTRHYKKWHQKEQKDLSTLQDNSSREQSTSQVSITGESDENENNSEDSDSDSAPYFPCHVCGKTFPTSESLEDHQLCHLGEKPHECEECGRCFFQSSQLQQHQRMHKSEFQCQACGRGFVSLFALRKHKHSHGKSRPYRCSKCPLSFTGPSQLAEHMSTHREENFPCDICNHVFLSKSSRAEHRKSHSKSMDQSSFSVSREEHQAPPSHSDSSSVISKELKYRCGVCSERFRDPEELSEHGCMAANERPYSCSDCDKYFLHASHLKKHRATHQLSWSNSEYPCNQCNKSFSSSQQFLSHLKTHIDNAREIDNENAGPPHGFICPVCHQCFVSASELSCHFPTHPDGTFECKHCKVTFPSVSQLEEHKRCHLISATEFECTECGRSFLGSNAFLQHHCARQKNAVLESECSNPSAKASLPTYQAAEDEEIDVTGVDLYNCPLCSMQFSSKSGLLEHQNRLHSMKPFKCELCGKTFAMRRYLKEHERRHRQKLVPQNATQSTNKFRCNQCRTEFSTGQDLSLHMRLHAEKQVGEYRCDMCYKSFSHWSLLKQHQESHVGQVVYECTECDKAFAFPHLLEEHQQAHANSSRL
ncbi:zinc finger protein 1035 [Mastacembelus armatus]|uniref:zinc finger protein 1035 n=1 Tax=Mastacembelus armatus TaxID=205130 RepID=UPI000E466195|nr:uncharacterized protein LOC113122246 [Mastacembelus armatus]XP_026149222.1 uncharacterized protein LOC113122246 [Mastacembelus armatus]XP_026149223.1 uncharacterized protein LOC113122246 [Mastacembelus armatus]